MISKILILFSFIIGCENPVSSPQEISKQLTPRVVYFKDSRTNICFAQITSSTYYGYNVVSISQVNCSEEVLELVK